MKRNLSALAAVAAGLLFVSACAPVVTSPESLATPITESSAPTALSATAVAFDTSTEPLADVTPVTVTAATPTEPPADATAAPEAGQQKTVTLDDQGKTIDLLVGERFLLNLGEGYTWEVEISDPNVVSRVTNITVIRGAQGVYEALQPGTTTLSATGDPACRQTKPPCAMPTTLFTVTLVVS
ncbi:MAG: hypothetical protein KDI07_05825 [Anaerolineae bacterium]|nr:hypothetical protein [Anaerolineae bacterium]MCB0233573.1 hypothetical protein [Anaerolineae bacterium]MCB0244346.1 hypothetical protein [Anaerolineae bacterium]MCB0248079.1 hypothetical protein [Anaerolineae bacterium]MCO5245024.1 hypothetical protein [Anaerolineae bacterium]